MKNLIFVLFIVGLANLTIAQENLAMNTTNKVNVHTSRSSKIQNEQYLNSRNGVAPTLALGIKRLQNVAADYDITENRIYSINKHITYTVVFESGANYIKAIYAHDGTILESEEYYEGVRVPYSLGSEIAKTYPGWSFNNSDCIIEYTKNKATRFTYSFVLKKGNKSKMIRRTLYNPVKMDTRSTGM